MNEKDLDKRLEEVYFQRKEIKEDVYLTGVIFEYFTNRFYLMKDKSDSQILDYMEKE